MGFIKRQLLSVAENKEGVFKQQGLPTRFFYRFNGKEHRDFKYERVAWYHFVNKVRRNNHPLATCLCGKSLDQCISYLKRHLRYVYKVKAKPD